MALPSAKSPVRPGGKDEVLQDEWMRWSEKRVSIRCVAKNGVVPRIAHFREMKWSEGNGLFIDALNTFYLRL